MTIKDSVDSEKMLDDILSSQNELVGTDVVASMLRDMLSGIPETDPIPYDILDFANRTNQFAVEYLPNYAGLPELQSYTNRFPLFCAESEGFYLNTSESRIAVVRCGFVLALPVGMEAQIRALPELSAIGIAAQFGSVDIDQRTEASVVLVNLSTTRQRIERGQRIAQMVLTGNLVHADLISVRGLVNQG